MQWKHKNAKGLLAKHDTPPKSINQFVLVDRGSQKKFKNNIQLGKETLPSCGNVSLYKIFVAYQVVGSTKSLVSTAKLLMVRWLILHIEYALYDRQIDMQMRHAVALKNYHGTN